MIAMACSKPFKLNSFLQTKHEGKPWLFMLALLIDPVRLVTHFADKTELQVVILFCRG